MAAGEKDVANRGVVLFDFDGTLADSVGAIVSTARKALLAHGFSADELGDLTRIVGPPFPFAFSLVYGLSAEEAARVTETYRGIYSTLGIEAWPLFDGMRELLEHLRAAGRRLAVASSKRQETLDCALSDNGATDLFEVVLGKPSDELETKAELIARALKIMGVSPDDAVMIGDRSYDAEAATACGLPCVGVTYGGGTADELCEAGACVLADSVAELGRVLLGDRVPPTPRPPTARPARRE